MIGLKPEKEAISFADAKGNCPKGAAPKMIAMLDKQSHKQV
ncbi:hypothetical protein [Allocoleopsis sp.]